MGLACDVLPFDVKELRMKKPSIGVALITHNAKHHLPHCLPPLLGSSLRPKVLVVNSSSSDGTCEEAKKLGAEVLLVSRASFNHGSTRDLARRALGTEIVVMMTPDAYAATDDLLEKLIAPLIEKKASVSYARQLPHKNAPFFEAFPRHFNYPEKSQLRSLSDVKEHGVYTFFCSNSCAAYVNEALEEVGGFPSVLLGEDTVVVSRLLHLGHKIAYVSDAKVHHSHDYSLIQEFKRSFDTGLARKSYRNLLALGGKDTDRGKKYVKALLKEIALNQPAHLPYAAVQVCARWLGYRLGERSFKAPLWWKKKLTSQDFYWTSDDYKYRGLRLFKE